MLIQTGTPPPSASRYGIEEHRPADYSVMPGAPISADTFAAIKLDGGTYQVATVGTFGTARLLTLPQSV